MCVCEVVVGGVYARMGVWASGCTLTAARAASVFSASAFSACVCVLGMRMGYECAATTHWQIKWALCMKVACVSDCVALNPDPDP